MSRPEGRAPFGASPVVFTSILYFVSIPVVFVEHRDNPRSALNDAFLIRGRRASPGSSRCSAALNSDLHRDAALGATHREALRPGYDRNGCIVIKVELRQSRATDCTLH